MQKNISSYLEQVKKIVDPVIEELLSSCLGSRFQEEVLYQVKAGGKRLRPAFVILSCKAVNGKTEDALYSAGAVEILHNYSLIIDDMIDHSEIRRGDPTLWKKLGISGAECVAMHYAAVIPKGGLKSSSPEKCVKILTEALEVLTEGETVDVLQELKGREEEVFVKENRYKNIKIEDALMMAEKKTARLFEASCYLGGVCGKGSVEEVELLKKYGLNLGMAFQIQDDILDIFGEEKKFGKKIGKDIEERKGGNIVVLFALEEDKEGELWELINKEYLKDEDLIRAKDIIAKTEAKKRAVQLAEKYMEEARNAISGFEKNKEVGIMEDMINFMLTRKI
jgi:geranylgeranyl diphosphate synthase type I